MTEWAVLSSLSAEDRAQLLGAGRRRRFAKNETLFHHGDPADSVHLLASGRVAVRVLTPEGNQLILTVLGPGQVVGEIALIDPNARRTATVTALQACETIALSRREFERLRARHPQVNEFLLASLAAQVNRLSEHLLEMLFVPAARRVARRLLILSHEFGDEEITLTQEDIAFMAGTTRSTVNEVLGDLERSGAVRVRRARVEIRDRAILMRRIGPTSNTGGPIT